MSGGDANFIAEMVSLFKEQMDEYSVQMPELLREKDYDGLSKVAHKAKSSVAVMGMNSVAELLKELEILAHEEKETERYESMIHDFLEQGKLAVVELKQSMA